MRERWSEYRAAFEEAITRTSTADAPWFVVPSDRKWYRNLVVGTTLVSALEGLELRHPEPDPGISEVKIPEAG